MPDENGHFTYAEWRDWTVNKIATNVLQHTSEEHRDGYLRVQIRAAIQQALAHGRSGRTDDDLVVGPFDFEPLPSTKA